MKKIDLRAVTIDDRDDLFRWRNDEGTRRVSFSSDPIPYDQHIKWLNQVLEDPNRKIFIGEDGKNNKLGMIRIDKLNEKVAEVSVNLAPEMRGKGYGAILINQVCEETVDTIFIARTWQENIASIKVFRKAQFIDLFSYKDAKERIINVLLRLPNRGE